MAVVFCPAHMHAHHRFFKTPLKATLFSRLLLEEGGTWVSAHLCPMKTLTSDSQIRPSCGRRVRVLFGEALGGDTTLSDDLSLVGAFVRCCADPEELSLTPSSTDALTGLDLVPGKQTGLIGDALQSRRLERRGGKQNWIQEDREL